MKRTTKFDEILELCKATQSNKPPKNWETLNEFAITSPNVDFDAKVYKQGNNIVIAFAGTEMDRTNNLKNDLCIMLANGGIPSQFGDAEKLYRKVRNEYPNAILNLRDIL